MNKTIYIVEDVRVFFLKRKDEKRGVHKQWMKIIDGFSEATGI